ncbi:MAG: hypothetical protein Q8R76_03015 [Candidatus Omnitrophota bacterium]|nr:hypothetical protein [Candidatus Omnitrophota bacterium]
MSPSGAVFALVASVEIATRLVKAAKHCHAQLNNFDDVERLLAFAREKPPMFIILDWDEREAQAFRLLQALRSAGLDKVPTVGFSSQSKGSLREEAQRAGCHRVYPKSEFIRNLDDIFMRYVT